MVGGDRPSSTSRLISLGEMSRDITVCLYMNKIIVGKKKLSKVQKRLRVQPVARAFQFLPSFQLQNHALVSFLYKNILANKVLSLNCSFDIV